MWWIIPAAIAAFIAVLLIRTAMFKPKAQAKCEATPTPIDGKLAAEHLQQMIRCKTVSYYDKSLIDEGEFTRFRELVKTLYPRLTAAAEYREFDPGMMFH